MEGSSTARCADGSKHSSTAAETENSTLSKNPTSPPLLTVERFRSCVSNSLTFHQETDFIGSDPLHQFEACPYYESDYFSHINPLQHSQDQGVPAHCLYRPRLSHSEIDEPRNMPQERLAMQNNEAASYPPNEFDIQLAAIFQPPNSIMDDWSTLSPLDRWENSPPEAEAASLNDIMSSVTKDLTQRPQGSRQRSQVPSVPKHQSQWNQRQSPSVAASDSARSSASSSSASSTHSFGSNKSNSFGKFYVGESTRRRRRKQKRDTYVHHNQSEWRVQRPYQCTFCTDAFKSKHDWVRHEKTLHLSLEKWPCAPFGPIYEDEVTSIPQCVFCGFEHPPENHIREHRFWECQEKPLPLRTFYRKDHLTQHLRLVHGYSDVAVRMSTWKSEVTHVNSRCGFCGATFTQWPERNDHLAAHFRSGVSMKDWKGCRGLDPAVALAVENAMPPYLIGIESKGVEPFRASRRGGSPQSANNCSDGTNHPNQETEPQPTPFEQLTEHLIRYVRGMQAQGSPITDEAIQQEARVHLYGDEDPWNQTAADNPEWLRLFKDGIGLDTRESDPDRANVSSNSMFPLPWTANEERPELQNEICPDGLARGIDPWMPWAWQSPECLAEFRKFRDTSISCSTLQQNLKHPAKESPAAEADIPF